LDKINEREALKIGVLFVGPGQTTEQGILSSSQGTTAYNDFLHGLGWVIDLQSHRGFMGGLDPHVNGRTTMYYASATAEIIFHVVTLMPTDMTDDKQLHKKRHVGNDSVHIVWCENMCDSYDPHTIKSQFNDAHIIIYPLRNGLFRIQIFKKPKVEFFGPLVSGMTVGLHMLPILVRQTAINATRCVRASVKGYKKPFVSRRESIVEIATRHKCTKSFGEFYTSFYQAADHTAVLQREAELEKEKEREKYESQSGSDVQIDSHNINSDDVDRISEAFSEDDEDEYSKVNQSTDSAMLSKQPSEESIAVTSNEEDTDDAHEDFSFKSNHSAPVPKIKIPVSANDGRLSPNSARPWKAVVAPTPPNTPNVVAINNHSLDPR